VRVLADKLKRRLKVQELLFAGYDQNSISEKMDVSVRTIARDVQSIRDKNKNWLEDLAEKGFAQEFRETLEGYKQDIMRLQEMQEECKDQNLRLKIIKTIADIRYKYAQQFAQFPGVWAMDQFVNRNNPQSIEQPTLPSLSEISGMVK